MSTFDASVRIGRPVEDVFGFVSDPLQFPRWNSAVHAVRITRGARGAADAVQVVLSMKAGASFRHRTPLAAPR